MATLEKIRNRAGVLIAVVIGVSLLAFILGDLVSSGSAILNKSKLEIAKIKGKSVSYQDYMAQVEELSNVYKLNTGGTIDDATMNYVREQTWQNMINDMILQEEYKELGLGVSGRELFEIIQGDNPHPIVRQMFTNPETGVVNRTQLLNFWKSLSEDPTGERVALARYIENSILRERLSTKYSNLIKKALYVTDVEAQNSFAETNKKVDFEYVVKRFNSISDSSVSITESDLKDYYKTHINEYKQDASRDIEYVVFEVVPSETDNKYAKGEIEDVKKEFAGITVDDASQFVRLNSDVPYQNKYYVDGELPLAVNDTMFMAKEDYIYGPYYEEGSYKLAKLLKIDNRPDSVHARHILIQPSQTISAEQAKAIADSLKTEIEKGADFGMLAMTNSVDPGSAQDGGDLGWFKEGMMIQSFNDACFEGKKNDVVVVESNYGYHIIEILEQGPKVKKVKVAIIQREVNPSKETINAAYQKASEFGANNRTREAFISAVETKGLNKRSATYLKPNDRTISGLEQPREMIQWAFNNDKGQVSEIFEFGTKYIIATISEIREEGVAPIEQVLPEVRLNVIKEKKGELIAKQMKDENAPSVSSLSSTLGLEVNNAASVSFSSFSIPNAGVEPKVIATALSLDENVLSKPIIGTNGVYVLNVTSVTESEVTDERVEMEKQRLTMAKESRANVEPLNALTEKANVKDERAKFF